MISTDNIIKTQNILKTYFLGECAEMLNKNMHPFLSVIKQTTSDVWGKEVRKAVLTERGIPFELRSELKPLYVDVEIFAKTINKPTASVIKAIGEEIVRASERNRVAFGRKLYGSDPDWITGFGKIFDEGGELYGNVRLNYSRLIPYRENDVGTLTVGALINKIKYLEMRNGVRPNLLLCSLDTRDLVLGASKTTRVSHRWGNTNYCAIDIDGVPLVADKYCPNGVMYLLNTDDFALHQLCDWRWCEDEFGMILLPSLTSPTYKARLVKYAELICERPFAQGILTGIK